MMEINSGAGGQVKWDIRPGWACAWKYRAAERSDRLRLENRGVWVDGLGAECAQTMQRMLEQGASLDSVTEFRDNSLQERKMALKEAEISQLRKQRMGIDLTLSWRY